MPLPLFGWKNSPNASTPLDALELEASLAFVANYFENGSSALGTPSPVLTPSGGDDAPQIQAALNSTGVAVLGAGSFSIHSTITVSSQQAIIGRGMNATVVTLAASVNADMIQTLNFATLTGTNTPASALDVWTLYGLTLDGNNSNNTSGRGISSYAIAPEINNVMVRNCAGEGMWWEGPTTDPGLSGRNHHIRDIRIHHCKKDGLVLQASDSSIEGFTIFQNGTIFGDPLVTQIRVNRGVAKIDNGHVWAGDSQYNVILNAACHIGKNVEIEGAPNSGSGGNGASVAVFSNGVRFYGYIYGNGAVTFPNAYAFQFGSGAQFIDEVDIDCVIDLCQGGLCHDFTQGPHDSRVKVLAFSTASGDLVGTCGTSFPTFSMFDLFETNSHNHYYRGGVVTASPINALAYGTTITPTRQGWQTITVTDAVAFTIANTSPTPQNFEGAQEITIEVLNSSGGAMGTITWNGAYVFPTGSWANPGNGKRRFAQFRWNQVKWVCVNLATADY